MTEKMTNMAENNFIKHGEILTPGYNVDLVDIKAGLLAGVNFGYGDINSQAVLEYALWRHSRGEEDGAEKSALSGGIDFTSWRVVLAHARASAEKTAELSPDAETMEV